MFDSLKKRLNQFKDSISKQENELDEAEFENADVTATNKGAEEARSERQSLDATRPLGQDPDKPQLQSARSLKERDTSAVAKQGTSKAFFEREIKQKDLEEPLWELEMALLESDVAMSVTEGIVRTVSDDLVGKKRKWRQDVGGLVNDALRDGIERVLDVNGLDFDSFIQRAAKPVTIVFTGINGTGKTTTIAKIAHRLKFQGYSIVLAAGDTYRAGALEQIERHAENLGVKLIKHQQGADPAAVIYDAVQYARAKHKDVVLADTAGRIHTNVNLMNQLKKIERVINADLVIFVDEALAGNDAVERALQFNTAMPIDGSILTKVDADSKGGAAISIARATGKPILFLGVGQGYEDIIKFDPEWLINRLLEEEST
ncbi:MAG: signal recognition particle-docking protein FtsY [Euryarchaeota archaeon]|nr:signal recognition particle-docking protein FtsY [Euryarchaeota archaeon]